jgi:ABC-type transporter Mla subunit MlaD
MQRLLVLIGVAAVASCLCAATLRADGSDASGEERLRQSLRDTMLQLRQAQADLASLQAAQAAQTDDSKGLKEQVALLTKHNADDKAEAAKTIENLKAKVTERETEVARLEGSLALWKAASEKMNQASKAAQDRIAKEYASAVVLEHRAEDLKAKNAELFRLASEILDRYEKFTLGQQFLAREPFIGRARADLESQIEDYSDQMEAQKATP